MKKPGIKAAFITNLPLIITVNKSQSTPALVTQLPDFISQILVDFVIKVSPLGDLLELVPVAVEVDPCTGDDFPG